MCFCEFYDWCHARVYCFDDDRERLQRDNCEKGQKPSCKFYDILKMELETEKGLAQDERDMHLERMVS